MEWTVVLVITALVGLFVTVGVPIINLNKNITTLNVNFKHINEKLGDHDEAIKGQQKHAHESHQKLWDKNDEQDKQLNDHETRISILEEKDK